MTFDARLLKRLANARPAFAGAVLWPLAGTVATIVLAWALSQAVARVFLDKAALSDVRPHLLALAAAALARAACQWAAQASAASLGARMKDGMRDDLVGHINRLGPSGLDAERSGELAMTLGRGIDSLDTWYSQFLPQVFLSVLAPALLLAFIFPRDWIAGLVMLLTAPLIPVFMALIGSVAGRRTKRQWKDMSRMSAYFLDAIQGLATLKLLGRGPGQADRIARVSEEYRKSTMGVLRIAFLSSLTLELLSTLSVAIVAVAIGLRLLAGRMDFDSGLFVLILAPEFYLPLRLLGARFHAGMEGSVAGQRMLDLLARPHAAAGAQTAPAPAPDAAGLAPIRFDDVTFTYPGAARPALDRLSVEFPAGRTTVLAGPSGAGKSTVFKLLLRFNEPDSGLVRIGDGPLPAIAPEEWRRRIAWVPQRPYLFHDTLANNIRLGRPDAPMDLVRRAAARARLDAFVESLPDGYDTAIGERGARLSAGQAQRVALARAFLVDAEWLLLDEPTSALDPENESEIRLAVADLVRGRSALVIAHRLGTVLAADRVVVLENGRVSDSGSPADLLSRDGFLSRIARAAAPEGRPVPRQAPA